MSDVVVTEPDGITPLGLLQEWVVELGLPSWEQTEGKLRDSEAQFDAETGKIIKESAAYCCLGVLCELGVRHGLVAREDNRYRWRDKVWPTEWNDGVLPKEFTEWLGLPANDPKVVDEECLEHKDEECPDGYACDYRHRETLSAINDSGQPFVWIRDLVQAQLVAPREAKESV